MVGVLVGDFKVGKAKKLIKKYFGNLPVSSPSLEEAKRKHEGGGIKKFGFNAEPAVALAYHKPTLPHTDEFIFDVIQVFLCDGPTSRLQKRLVYEEKVARVIYCSDSYPGSRFNNLFLIWAEPNRPFSPEKLASKIKQELNRLKTKPVSSEELSRVQKKVMATMIYALETNMGLAMALADFETVFSDWRLLVNYPEKIKKVTSSDVIRVAQEYFTKENETEVIRVRGKKKR